MPRRPPNNRAPHAVRRAVALAAALIVAGACGAACGGSPSASVANLGSSASTTTTVPSSNAGASRNAAQNSGSGGAPQGGGQQSTFGLGGVTVAFAECMRSHGVPSFPDPNGQGVVSMNGVNPQSPSFAAAQRACAKYSRNGGGPLSPAQQQRAIAQALRFSECMRSHGITDFPDPKITTGGGGISISIRLGGHGSDLDPRDPKFAAAQKVCQPLLPGPKTKANG